MKNPTLSIITINYNSGMGLEKTVDSIIKFLDKPEIEFILVDGLSTDDSLTRIGNKKNTFLSIISENDTGIYDAMNKGLRKAKGKWIWFLNSGDVALQSSTLLLDILNNELENYNFLYFNYITDMGDLINQNLTLIELFRGMINHQTIFYRRDLINSYDPSFGLGADFAHLILNYSNIKHKKYDVTIVEYDTNGKSSAMDRGTKVKNWYNRFRAFKHSSLRLDYKIIGMIFSLLVCIAKIIYPAVGSRLIKLKYDRKKVVRFKRQ